MISQRKSTILVTALLSTMLLTTGCMQKQPERVVGQPSLQAEQQLGAKTVPYKEQSRPTVQHIQQRVQYVAPVQQRVQYAQPIIQAPVQQRVQYTQPTVHVEPIQQTVQYTTQEPTPIYREKEEEECTDDISSSNCQREAVVTSSNYSQSSAGGTVHTLKSVQGQTIKIGERANGFTFPNYPGKVVILEMFGKSCPHCIKEIPTLKKIKRRYGNKVEVVAIHSQGILSPSAARRFISQNRVNYPVTDGSRAAHLQNFIQNTYGWTGVLPFTMIIKDGQTEGSFGGEVSYKELKEVIDPLF